VISEPPNLHELEVSVFGPGVGECIVAHVGDGDWIVVDSCINRESQEPVALEYLKSLHVDIPSRVRLVVATHWHDDHIRGLAEVFRVAESAKFVDSAAYSLSFLARVVELGTKTAANASVTEEYSGIFEILKGRRNKGERKEAVGPLRAVANKRLLLLTGEDRTVRAEVTALSPSDGTFSKAEGELKRALSIIAERKRPSLLGPNQLSVVLWLRVGSLQVMLGADLEHVAGTTEGWKAIVNSKERPEGRAGIFKVSHHGSKNADCPECWDNLLSNQPIAVVTPYSPAKLPSNTDLARLCGQTNLLYLTSDHTRYKVPTLDRAVEKTLRESGIERRALEGKMGHVRLRADALDPVPKTRVELFNGAELRCA